MGCGPGGPDSGAPAGERAQARAAGVPLGEDFGAGLTLDRVLDLRDVVSDPDVYAAGPVLVRARVYDVCQRRGCWMVLRDGKAEARVRFKDYGFFVPRDCTGQLAYVEGTVATEVLPEREARHYAEESIRDDPAKVDGPQRIVAFEATGVRLVASD